MKMIKQVKYILLLLISIIILQDKGYSQSIFNYSLTDIDGYESKLADLKGENLTILDFWATWCKPCIKSIPKLVELSDEYKALGVNFIGINEDSPRNSSKVKPFAYSLGINYPVLLDSDQTLQNDFLINSLPTIIIINKKGEIIFTHIGYNVGDKEMLQEIINKLLDETK